ncbi:hypothetical protein ACHAXA_004465 [Cyclostephanos tholiformis]|uniref:Pectin acetylesterase n=1 Tax=Cyclostephanos tholiformis TaxID=382380 RepID=A0ABD3RHS0_9STRA
MSDPSETSEVDDVTAISESIDDDDDDVDVETEIITTHDHCDPDSLPAEYTAASNLTRDAFHKICPGERRYSRDGASVPLGLPRCGDGTAYSFLFSRPVVVEGDFASADGENATSTETTTGGGGGGGGGERVLIELSGGGACWDDETCSVQGYMLAFPSLVVDALVGTSCADANDSYGTLLCNRKVGGIDFSSYEYIFVPYCTQDAHMGDSPGSSDVTTGIATEYGVVHAGAHNLHRTLMWTTINFPNPSAVVLTGCSAGATPLAVAYDILNSHYAKMGVHDVRIDVIADSPVFLTPSYYMRHYLPNWNVGTILDVIDFDYEAHDDGEGFPDAILDHVLRGSKASDDFVYVTHDSDDVSLFYYMMMNGTTAPEDASAVQDTTLASAEWWSKMNDSLTNAMDGHANFQAFIMGGNGHCTFGLVSTVYF